MRERPVLVNKRTSCGDINLPPKRRMLNRSRSGITNSSLSSNAYDDGQELQESIFNDDDNERNNINNNSIDTNLPRTLPYIFPPTLQSFANDDVNLNREEEAGIHSIITLIEHIRLRSQKRHGQDENKQQHKPDFDNKEMQLQA